MLSTRFPKNILTFTFQRSQPATLLKQELITDLSLFKFCGFFKNRIFTDNVLATVSVFHWFWTNNCMLINNSFAIRTNVSDKSDLLENADNVFSASIRYLRIIFQTLIQKHHKKISTSASCLQSSINFV